MKNKIYFYFFLMAGFTYLAKAQEQESLFKQLIEENKSSVDALVLYPAEIRESILEVCTHPEALVKLDRIQKKSSNYFREIIDDFSRKEQGQFYDLVRYPNLVYQLVEGGTKSKEEIEEILDNYPDEIHDAALKRARKSYAALKEIESLSAQTDQAFDALLSGYDHDLRYAVNTLIEHPEILNILTDNLDLAILVGDVYREDPDMVLHKADSLQEIVAREQADELEDWKRELENDPRALAEMDRAGRDFARENDYDLSDQPDRERDVTVHFYPYPYWYGYPYWYTRPFWYPYPYWYHTGFYYSGSGAMVIIGLPSFYYSAWFYRYPVRYYYLDRHYWRYYDRYPHSRSSFRRGMRISRSSPSYQPAREPRRDRTIGTRQGRTTTIQSPQRTSRNYQRQRANEHHRSTWQPRSRVQSRSRTPSRSGTTKSGTVRRRTRQN